MLSIQKRRRTSFHEGIYMIYMYCIVLIVITCTFVIANIVCMILEGKAWAYISLGDFLECACLDILTYYTNL